MADLRGVLGDNPLDPFGLRRRGSALWDRAVGALSTPMLPPIDPLAAQQFAAEGNPEVAAHLGQPMGPSPLQLGQLGAQFLPGVDEAENLRVLASDELQPLEVRMPLTGWGGALGPTQQKALAAAGLALPIGAGALGLLNVMRRGVDPGVLTGPGKFQRGVVGGPGSPDAGVVGGELAGWKRLKRTSTKGTEGQWVGAPPRFTSADVVSKEIDDYVAKMEEAVAAGIPPGYFYQQAHEQIARAASRPSVVQDYGYAHAITSPNARVARNQDYALAGLLQHEMGAPIDTGLYRKNASRTLQRYFDQGPAAVGGRKVQDYNRSAANPLAPDAPGANDTWEIKGVWKDEARLDDTGGATLSSDAQHDFMHAFRREATRRYNAKHGTNLNPANAQELHWAAMKIRSGDTPERIMDRQTIQATFDDRTLAMTQETFPGGTGPLTPTGAFDPAQHHAGMLGVMRDPQTGHNRLLTATGFPLQQPIETGRFGAFTDDAGRTVVGENMVSRPIVPLATRGVQGKDPTFGMLDPSARAPTRGASRAYAFLGAQDADAMNMLVHPTSGTPVSALDAAGIEAAAPLTQAQTEGVFNLVNETWPQTVLSEAGPVQPWLTQPFVAPTSAGRTALLAPQHTPRFREGLDQLANRLGDVLGGPAKVRLGKQFRLDPEQPGYIDWAPWGAEGQSPVTNWLFEAFDDPNAPNLARKMDSAETRGIVGDTLDFYDGEVAAGRLTMDPKYRHALETWSKKGLAALREAARKGTVPAFVAAAVLPDDDERI